MNRFIPEIMREASKIMLSAHHISAAVTSKSGDSNFVTQYDVAVEQFLIEKLTERLPHAVVIGEEESDNHTEKIASSLSLIIDPIDGTTNFIHHYAASSISVGVCDCGTMIYGAVYDPYTDRLFHAKRGEGAFVQTGGKEIPIRVSNRGLSDSLVAFGTSPYYRDTLGEDTFRAAYRLFREARDLRRSGSAAIDLTALARGSLDVFFEYLLSPWDFAASSLIIEEAGGVITQFDGSPVTFDRPCSVLAGNLRSHKDVLEKQIL